MKWELLQTSSKFMSIVSCDPIAYIFRQIMEQLQWSPACVVLGNVFPALFYQFSLYSSGHQIFMCVFELFYVVGKCLMLLYPGNKSSVMRQQTLSRPGITRGFCCCVDYTWPGSAFHSSVFSSLTWASSHITAKWCGKTLTLSDKGLLKIID